SLTVDPKQRGSLPDEHRLPVREVRLCAGAGFIVVVCGDIMTMPGLPRNPAALNIGLNKSGEITGLF
ncbi:MAG TPA: formate--tetrahydrofolate ligase, partial [Gammaproteobacteria bacterium]|nr:formate--tetrahydrofolate ligase [Gammaproteobacteria bacterium]